jgi:hypothetical protein
MKVRRSAVAAAVACALLALTAAPVFAHDCFNPTKNEHAPTGGVNYTITGFGEEGPEFEKTGPGKGYGGFVAIASPEGTAYVHTLGKFTKENGHETVGGPGSEKPEHACNGKGIDYLEACSTEEG